MDNEESRKQFEEWISGPPYKRPIWVLAEQTTAPGQYVEYDVQIAWAAWKASRDRLEKLGHAADREI